MKKLSVVFVALAAIVCMTTSCDAKMGGKMNSDIDSASYAIGILEGGRLKQGLEGIPGGYSKEALMAAYKLALDEDTNAMKMTQEEAQAYLQTYFPKAQEKEAKANKEASEKFLEENKKKDGVKVTESGLQYKVITEGTGARPDSASVVKVHYKGTTAVEGKEFDSSYKRNEPTTFALNQVIPGWGEGLRLMTVGSKYIFYIPSELGYGERGASAELRGNMALVFEVELLEIVQPEAPATEQKK